MNDPVRRWYGFLAAQQQRRFALILVGVLLLGAAPVVREFTITIHDRRVDAVDSTIRVNRGEVVLLRWRTDEQVSLHVHGYDIEATLSPGASNVVRIQAKVAGRFPITAHQFGTATESHSSKHREVTLLYLEVLPE
jgi:FtsP/CotA-like multicopper oxidase with cupredoxin domain